MASDLTRSPIVSASKYFILNCELLFKAHFPTSNSTDFCDVYCDVIFQISVLKCLERNAIIMLNLPIKTFCSKIIYSLMLMLCCFSIKANKCAFLLSRAITGSSLTMPHPHFTDTNDNDSPLPIPKQIQYLHRNNMLYKIQPTIMTTIKRFVA